MKTFDIIKDFRALEELSNAIDAETGEFINSEDDLSSFLIELNYHKEIKLDNIQNLKLEIEHKALAIKEKVDALNKRKKHFEKTIENLTNLQLMLLNGEKCETSEWTFSFRKSESVEINPFIEPSQIDKDYIRTKLEFDKVAIKKALKDGIVLNGIELVENKNLVIK